MKHYLESCYLKRLLLSFLLVVSCNCYSGFMLPDYAGSPNSTSSTWNYAGDWAIDDTNQHLTSWMPVVGAYDLVSINDFGGCGVVLIPPVAASPCFRAGGGNNFDLYIPNFVDELYTKLMRIQFQFVLSNFPNPTVDVFGFDPEGFPAGELVTSSMHTDNFLTNGVFYTYIIQDWIIHPNPDYERISFSNVAGTELRDIRIDTISVVEPETFLLVGTALLGLGLIHRRRLLLDE